MTATEPDMPTPGLGLAGLGRRLLRGLGDISLELPFIHAFFQHRGHLSASSPGRRCFVWSRRSPGCRPCRGFSICRRPHFRQVWLDAFAPATSEGSRRSRCSRPRPGHCRLTVIEPLPAMASRLAHEVADDGLRIAVNNNDSHAGPDADAVGHGNAAHEADHVRLSSWAEITSDRSAPGQFPCQRIEHLRTDVDHGPVLDLRQGLLTTTLKTTTPLNATFPPSPPEAPKVNAEHLRFRIDQEAVGLEPHAVFDPGYGFVFIDIAHHRKADRTLAVFRVGPELRAASRLP